jgi:hypothetical protein
MRKHWASLVFVALAVLVLAVPAHAARVESQTYLGVTGDAQVLCTLAPDDGLDALGGACFAVLPEDATADVVIEDDVFEPVGAFWQFTKPGDDPLTGGEVLLSGAFCGSASLSIPPEATNLNIFVDEVNGLIDCPDAPPGAGTTGTITVAFT